MLQQKPLFRMKLYGGLKIKAVSYGNQKDHRQCYHGLRCGKKMYILCTLFLPETFYLDQVF